MYSILVYSSRPPKKSRTSDSFSTSGDVFATNLMKQQDNHQHNEVLQLQNRKLQSAVKQSEVELEKAKFDLNTARELATIEIAAKKRLAELEIKIEEKQLGIEYDILFDIFDSFIN